MIKFSVAKIIGAANFFPASRCSGGTMITTSSSRAECSDLRLRNRVAHDRQVQLPSSSGFKGIVRRLDHQLESTAGIYAEKSQSRRQPVIHRGSIPLKGRSTPLATPFPLLP